MMGDDRLQRGVKAAVWRALWVGMVFVAACGTPEARPDSQAGSALLRVDLDKSNPERLVRYYFGGYAAEGGADPVAAGIVREDDGDLFVDVAVLERVYPGAQAALENASLDGRLTWDELKAFVQETYYEARGLPPTLDAFRAEVPYGQGEEAWFEVKIDGVMTNARRKLFVPESALRYALQNYHKNGGRLIYPEGTAIVGEHHLDGEHVETTVMWKRQDGFWDFATYGSDGRLASSTRTPPRELESPTQCVGCHFGSKLFEPERSFPAAASDGPHGPRAVYVDETLRDAEVTTFFDEHSKRSDTVLGLYNTLFVAQLRAQRAAGTLSEEDAKLLENLGL